MDEKRQISKEQLQNFVDARLRHATLLERRSVVKKIEYVSGIRTNDGKYNLSTSLQLINQLCSELKEYGNLRQIQQQLNISHYRLRNLLDQHSTEIDTRRSFAHGYLVYRISDIKQLMHGTRITHNNSREVFQKWQNDQETGRLFKNSKGEKTLLCNNGQKVGLSEAQQAGFKPAYSVHKFPGHLKHTSLRIFIPLNLQSMKPNEAEFIDFLVRFAPTFLYRGYSRENMNTLMIQEGYFIFSYRDTEFNLKVLSTKVKEFDHLYSSLQVTVEPLDDNCAKVRFKNCSDKIKIMIADNDLKDLRKLSENDHLTINEEASLLLHMRLTPRSGN